MTDAPDRIYLTEVDYEDPDYPLVRASASMDSGGIEYLARDGETVRALVAALREAATRLRGAGMSGGDDDPVAAALAKLDPGAAHER